MSASKLWRIEYEIPPLRAIYFGEAEVSTEAEARAIVAKEQPTWRIRKVTQVTQLTPGSPEEKNRDCCNMKIIKVTKEHIEKGKPGAFRGCPVHLATGFSVGYGCSWFGFGFISQYIKHSPGVHDWITAFDQRRKVFPIKLVLTDTHLMTAQEFSQMERLP